jgi:predicted nucleic acid-binding protein
VPLHLPLRYKIQNSILIIDEKKGRKVARSLNLQIIGTLRVLLLAKQKGVIKNIFPLIEELEKKNFRFSKILIDQVLTAAKETR